MALVDLMALFLLAFNKIFAQYNIVQRPLNITPSCRIFFMLNKGNGRRFHRVDMPVRYFITPSSPIKDREIVRLN